jgi:hypothetical protein
LAPRKPRVPRSRPIKQCQVPSFAFKANENLRLKVPSPRIFYGFLNDNYGYSPLALSGTPFASTTVESHYTKKGVMTMKGRIMNRSHLVSLLSGTALVLSLGACDVDQTKQGKLPDVDVKGGQLPEYDVDVADVDVKKKKVEVPVPDVDVKMPTDSPAEERAKEAAQAREEAADARADAIEEEAEARAAEQRAAAAEHKAH